MRKGVVLALGKLRRSLDFKAAVVRDFAELGEVEAWAAEAEVVGGDEGFVEWVAGGRSGAVVLHVNNCWVDNTVKISSIFINRISFSKGSSRRNLYFAIDLAREL